MLLHPKRYKWHGFPFLGFFMYPKHHLWDSHWVIPGTSHSRKSASKYAESLFLHLVPTCIACDLCSVAALLTWSNDICLLNSWSPFLLLWIWLWLLPFSILWIWTQPSYPTPCFLRALYYVNLSNTCYWSSRLALAYLLVPSQLSFLIPSWFWNLWLCLDLSHPFYAAWTFNIARPLWSNSSVHLGFTLFISFFYHPAPGTEKLHALRKT